MVARVGEEVGRYVGRQDVVDQGAVATLHVGRALALRLHLEATQVQHSTRLLRLRKLEGGRKVFNCLIDYWKTCVWK